MAIKNVPIITSHTLINKIYIFKDTYFTLGIYMFALFMFGPLSLFALLIGIASIQLFLKTQYHDLIDFSFIITTAITIAITIFILYQFGLNQHSSGGDYANLSILFFGIIGWHLPFLLAGMFFHLWFSSHRAISFGCTIASIWWVFYIWSLTHWN